MQQRLLPVFRICSIARTSHARSRPTPLAFWLCPISTRRAASSVREDMDTINTTERLSRLRELMKQREVDIYSVPLDRAAIVIEY